MKATSLPQVHREGSFKSLSLSDWQPNRVVIAGSSLSNESTDVDEHKDSFLWLCLCLSRCLSLWLSLSRSLPTFSHLLLSRPHIFRSISVVRGRSAKHLEHIIHGFTFSRVGCSNAFYVLEMTCTECIVHGLKFSRRSRITPVLDSCHLLHMKYRFDY